jgi:8-oxo-dGTP pyrophosphatase MutT (NUDIX family)
MSPQPRPWTRPPHLPGEARQGAVLLLLYEQNGVVYIPFIRRPLTLHHHPGQIAFPGGRREPGETAWHTAVRETEEEIGIPPAELLPLGELGQIYIPPSDFLVQPVVAWHTAVPQFRPHPHEVAELLPLPLSLLLDSATRGIDIDERLLPDGTRLNIPYFRVGMGNDDKIWGGTAVILNEFLERMAGAG